MTQSGTALVLGATGGVGGEVSRALLKHSWAVRALARDPSKLAPGLTARQGDVMRRNDVMAAAEGVQVIVHAVNPPGYRNWGALVLPMIDNTIAAAEAVRARIVLPGTVYNYGADAGTVVNETSPQNPETKKGLLRVAMEQHLEAAARRGKARALILRAGDYFGPRPGNNWFSQGLVKPGRRVSSITYPGPFEVGHAWAYLPDVGETFARLLAREGELAPFDRFHLRGHWLEPGVEMAEAIRKALGRNVAIRKLPWPLLRLIAPFNETMRELLEMRYLWQRPLRLDNAKLKAFLGEEPLTPLPVAVEATLKGLGCT
jgi:nucleoside-diphosphate-sugar epimerase